MFWWFFQCGSILFIKVHSKRASRPSAADAAAIARSGDGRSDDGRRRVRLHHRRCGVGRLSVGQSALGRLRSSCPVLEAGGRDNWIWFHIPVGYLFAIGDPRPIGASRPNPRKASTAAASVIRAGKVIGGSSAINAMVYMRGQSADYDHWRQLGLTGWGWDDVLPYFKRHEDHFLGESDLHGVGGELPVQEPRVRWDLLDAFRAAAEQADIKSVPDFNTGDNEGFCAFHVNQKRGRRWSSAAAFLKPVLDRSNLRLETGCLVEGVVFDDKRAVGVRWRQDGQSHIARCRGEVVFSAGSIGSAQIMLLSGVGRRSSSPARHSGRRRSAGRRRQSAGSFAASPHL